LHTQQIHLPLSKSRRLLFRSGCCDSVQSGLGEVEKSLRNVFYESQFKNLSDKSILITGGTGKLAKAFYASIKANSPETQVILTTKENLDVEVPASFDEYFKFKPDYILHCAARVNADYCETNFLEAKRNIVGGAINTLKFAQKCGSRIFFPQSFLIHDGKENPVDESTTPNPISNYGRLKLEAEEIVQQQNNSLVVRMGGFFGGGKYDNNFVGKFSGLISMMIKEGKQSIEIGERIWQPTFINDLAANSLILIALEKSGVYNMAGHGQATFYDVASFIVDKLELANRIQIRKMQAEQSRQLDIALRPDSINMINSRLSAEFIDFQRHWRISLNEYLESYEFNSTFSFSS